MLKRLNRAAVGAVIALALAPTLPAQVSPSPVGPSAGGTPARGAPRGQKVADAQPGDVRVFATAAIAGPLEAVKAQAQSAVGKPLIIQYGSARADLQKAILSGQTFEVAILLPDVHAELLAQDKIMSGEYKIAHVQVGIGIRGDVKVDVSTPEALKRTLLNAAGVSYAPIGAARDTVLKTLTELDIKNSIKDLSGNDNVAASPLQPGQYVISFYPLSESRPELMGLGPVIAPFQVPVQINAVIGAQANDRRAADALIKFLESKAFAPALRDGGMTPSNGG
jgi:molybdate transport system substrate-binding protein